MADGDDPRGGNSRLLTARLREKGKTPKKNDVFSSLIIIPLPGGPSSTGLASRETISVLNVCQEKERIMLLSSSAAL